MNTQEAMNLLLSDRRLFIESLMEIENKSRKLVPFQLNPIQADMYETSTGRDIYVKAAQIGASSYFINDFLCDCVSIPGTTAAIISYDEFITGRLLRKAHTAYKILNARIPSVPKLDHRSTSEMTFPEVNSSFYIGSARQYAFGRGETIHDLLLDEYGFWQPGDAERVFGSALQRVPLEPRTKVRIVSTPNGQDNDFYDAYMAAKEGKEIGKSVFKAHFYPWYIHPEYTMLWDSPFCLPGDNRPLLDLTPDELLLTKRLELLSIDEEGIYNKIRWRRYKIAEMESLRRSGETRLLFSQEYPEDDVSCFQAAGDMVYDTELINAMAKNCYTAPIRHLFTDIWYPPEPGVKYLVAIDPGQGKTSESVATVWTFSEEEFKHHATLSGLYPQDEMAEKSKELAYYYNGAVIANEDSLDMTFHLKDYPNLYYRSDPVTGRVSMNIGWATTPKTKPYMITEVNRHLVKVLTHDIRIVSQLRNIRWLQGRRGEIAAPVGADDYHDSMAIGIVCRETLPIERGLVGVSGWSDTWGR